MSPLLSLLLVIFIGIVAVALLMQSVAFWILQKSISRMSRQVEAASVELQRNAGTITAGASDVLQNVKGVVDRVQGMQESLAETTAMVQRRAVDIDKLVGEATDAARLQIIRLQDVLDNASGKLEDTFDSVHRGVVVPIQEINAIVVGLRVGLDALLGRRRRPSRQAHQDEEMFI